MADAERLQIGHDGGRGVEIEIGSQLQAIGRDRYVGSHHRESRRQNTDHGGIGPLAAPPQIGVPMSSISGRGISSSDRLPSTEHCAIARASSPSRRVRRVRLAECRAGQPRNDFFAANREQVPHQRQPPAPVRLIAGVPIQHRGFGGRSLERVGDLVAVFRIGVGKFPAPPLPHGLGEFAFEVTEEREWRF